CATTPDDTRCLVDGMIVRVDHSRRVAQLVRRDGGASSPMLVLANDRGRLVEIRGPPGAEPIAIVLAGYPGGIGAIAMSPRLAQSMFVRLHYLDGASLGRVHVFAAVDSPLGTRTYDHEHTSSTRVRVYRVDW